ncbi:MAG: MXAN_6577-like cysteine-rich protein [Sandaracinaceae bacterium]
MNNARIVALCVAAAALGSLVGCQSSIVGSDCRADLTLCGDVCVDLSSDPLHCGACDVACADEQACRFGMCVDDRMDAGPAQVGEGGADGDVLDPDAGLPADAGPPPGCDLGELACSGECVRPDTDRRHCGGCGAACGFAEVCALGECVYECGAPLAECDGICVDPRSNPDHCGACGTQCPSGVCAYGVCQGPLAGHVVVIGHDYVVSRPLMNRLAGNAVFLVPRSPARVLVYEGDATSRSIAGTDAAIDQVADETGRTWTREPVVADEVSLRLASSDAFVVYAQSGAESDRIKDLARLWGAALGTFLRRGGVLVVFDGAGINDGTHRLLGPLGLMRSTGVTVITGEVLDVVNPSDALALGVPLRYRGESSSVRFGTRDGTPVVMDSIGPVVLHDVVLP